MTNVSGIGRAYQAVYDLLAGRHPRQRPWHFQWAGVAALHARLRALAPTVSGRILDVGCGDKPYRSWFTAATEYVGIDVEDTAAADVVIDQESAYPFADGEFDAVVAFEVLEHVENIDLTLEEMFRVVRPGGRVIASIPFLYNEHGAPGDYRRLTRHSARTIVKKLGGAADLSRVETLGGVGSTLNIVLLNWLETASNHNRITRLVKGVLLPVWIALALLTNVLGWLMDTLDKTGSFYHHVLLEFRKIGKNSLRQYR